MRFRPRKRSMFGLKSVRAFGRYKRKLMNIVFYIDILENIDFEGIFLFYMFFIYRSGAN